MKIVYYDVKQNSDLDTNLGATYKASVGEVLAVADVITIHVPLLESTRHLIDAQALTQCKPSAYIVNTSRGPVIDEVALVEALREQRIKGAGLDVFEHEPKLTEGLTDLEHVVLTPHIASATEATRGRMSEIVARNVIAVLRGEEAPNEVTT